jgi:long-subunit fatty acid transport protein
MIVVFRTRGQDWDKFVETVRTRKGDIEGTGAQRVWVHRNRSHPDEWMMVQQWPDKASFDGFAKDMGPKLDQQGGVKWTDVSTWEEVQV